MKRTEDKRQKTKGDLSNLSNPSNPSNFSNLFKERNNKMNTKKIIAVFAVALAAAAVLAAPTARGKKGPKAMAGNEDGPVTTGKEAKILVDQMPKTGQQSCLPAPGIQGASMVGQC